MIQLTVNGDSVTLPQNSKVSTLIEQLALSQAKIAVELNQEIVPRSHYDIRTLCDGDVLEIVQAIGGG